MSVSTYVKNLICTPLCCAYCDCTDVSTISTDICFRTGINFCVKHEEAATRDFFAFYFLRNAIPLPHALYHNSVVRTYVTQLSEPSSISMTRSSGAVETDWRMARSHDRDLVPFFTKNPDDGSWSFMAENSTGALRKTKLIDDPLFISALNSFSSYLLDKLSAEAKSRRDPAMLAWSRARHG